MSNPTIGIRRRCIEIFRSHGIVPFRAVLDPSLFSDCAPNCPRSSCILTPEIVFWLMASACLSCGVMAAATRNFWAVQGALFSWLPALPVSEEAFCIARGKLPLAFFRRVFQKARDRFQLRFRERYLWRGFRLWGIDGTRLSLSPYSPPLRSQFPSTSPSKKPSTHPLALLVGLVGLRDGVCQDFIFTSLRHSEQRCARLLIRRHLKSGDLLLCDRNFADFQTFLSVLRINAHFLFRIPQNRFTSLRRHPTSSQNPNEWTVTLEVPKGLSLPDGSRTLTLRILQYQIHGWRPTRLATSLLDSQAFPYHELVQLYHERWTHETVHREWKQSLQLSNLRSLTPQGILKEIYVQITLNNVIRWWMADAAADDLRPTDLQFLETKRVLLSHLPVLMALSGHALAIRCQKLLACIRTLTIRKRPGRSYPRKADDKPRNRGDGFFTVPNRLSRPEGGTYAFV